MRHEPFPYTCRLNHNTQLCHILKKSPYEVVYGQPPRIAPFAELPKGKGSCIMEEVADRDLLTS